MDHFFNVYCRENAKFLDSSGRSMLHFQPEALQVLMEHSWPGNVRELENVVERAVVLATDAGCPHRRAAGLPAASQRRAPAAQRRNAPCDPMPTCIEIVNDYERRVIVERLEHCGWSQTEAAESLNVPLSTLNQKIKRLNIKIRKKSGSDVE